MILLSIMWLRSRLIIRVLFNWNILSLLLIVFGFLAFLVYAIVATDMSATVLSLIFEEPTYLSSDHNLCFVCRISVEEYRVLLQKSVSSPNETHRFLFC